MNMMRLAHFRIPSGSQLDFLLENGGSIACFHSVAPRRFWSVRIFNGSNVELSAEWNQIVTLASHKGCLDAGERLYMQWLRGGTLLRSCQLATPAPHIGRSIAEKRLEIQWHSACLFC
ncbi:unnamed protein product [Cercospora beticola]|nr:unnamed protein product [Cercospora beticola]